MDNKIFLRFKLLFNTAENEFRFDYFFAFSKYIWIIRKILTSYSSYSIDTEVDLY